MWKVTSSGEVSLPDALLEMLTHTTRGIQLNTLLIEIQSSSTSYLTTPCLMSMYIDNICTGTSSLGR